jgi:CNT family concentrative nucleoside transporter
MTIMTSGMAHVSGGIMAAYILFGINAKDLLSAVIMTAPGTILVAKMLVPETEVPATAGTVHMPPNEEHKNENFIAAIARGTIDGGQLAFNVAIMLISFVALVGLFNAIMLGISNFAWNHGHIPFPHSLNARPRRRRRARRLAHRHPLARVPHHRQPARHPHHDQRVPRLQPSSAS